MSKHSLDPELSGFIYNLRAALLYLEEFEKKTFVIYLKWRINLDSKFQGNRRFSTPSTSWH